MQKERFEYKQGVVGCEWAIISPIAVALIFSLIGAIYCKASGQSAQTLDSNVIFLTITTVCTELGFLFVAWCIAKHSKTKFIAGLGLKTRTPWWTYLVAIAISVAVLFLLNPIINAWQYMLETAQYKSGNLPFQMDSVGNLFLGLLLFALVPAVCEETLFRGVILNGLRKYGLFLSVGMSALFFSLMHMSLLQLPYTFLLGLVLGLVVYFTRNLWLSMLMHFINNGAVLLSGFLSDEVYCFVWYDILWGIGGLIIFAGLMFLLYKALKKFFWDKTQSVEQAFCDSEPTIPQKTRAKMWIAPIFIATACIIISILGGFSIL